MVLLQLDRKKGVIVVNDLTGNEVKASLVTRIQDWWMERRVQYGTYTRIAVGLTALAAFIYFLARSAAS